MIWHTASTYSAYVVQYVMYDIEENLSYVMMLCTTVWGNIKKLAKSSLPFMKLENIGEDWKKVCPS